MKEIFKQLILDFYDETLPEPVLRHFEIPELPDNIRKAFVFVGMRRSGKTWAMYQHIQNILNHGIDKKKILYINFEDDRLSEMQTNHFQSIIDAYFTLYPQYVDERDLHFFFDEIHEIDNWEKFIRRILDRESINIYISGSSAKMLSKEIASVLRGRTIVIEIFPFSFNEYLSYQHIPLKQDYSTKQRSTISYHLQEYLTYGGFPEAISMKKNFHRNLLQGYIDVVVYRDIIERYNISNMHVVKELLKFCIQNTSSLISINKIYQRFKSHGKKIGKNSIYQFMDYFEDAYCIFTVPIYSHSINKQNINPKKIYAIDQGLITAYTIKPEFEEASRLENLVFCQLRRTTEQIFYYKTNSGKEVDFLVINSYGKIQLIQVSVSLMDPNTKKRETAALTEAMDELSLDSATIITIENDEKINFETGSIYCISLWQWLLSRENNLYIN
jgi:hypothetical protein